MKSGIAGMVAVFCVHVLSLTATRADSLTVVTGADSAWRAIGPVGNLEGTGIDSVGLAWESANPGWNISLLYDDTDAAGWHAPTMVSSGLYGEQWPCVWSDGPQALGSTPSYFRTEVLIGGTPTRALLDCLMDDDAQIWINGELVLNDNNNTASTFEAMDVRRYLRSGLNLIAVKAHDSYPYAAPGSNHEAFALRLEVEFAPSALSIRCSEVELCWQSATNATYQVQYQSALTSGEWVDLGVPIVGDGSRKCITDTIREGEPRRFYRTVAAP